MSVEMLSEEEITVLKALKKGLSETEIADQFKISLEETRQLIGNALAKRDRLRAIAESRTVPAYIRTVDDRLNTPQTGTMKVGSRILKHLSEGIYSSPAGSLKELVSNSFDSDATQMDIRITENEVILRDNGTGMNWKDFDKDFTFISRSIKRFEGIKTQLYNRPIVGFLGIGFISVSELCDKLAITSCKKNEDRFFKARIDFSKYREPQALEKEFYEVSEYKLTNYLKKDRGILKEASFTEIRLESLRPGFKEIIADIDPFDNRRLGIKKILEHVSETGDGITDLGKYWQMIWELAYVCPIRYPQDGPVLGVSDTTVVGIKNTLESYNFKVFVNDVELTKPFRFPISDLIKVRGYSIHPVSKSIQTSEGPLSFEGYIYSQHGMINPKEYIGIMVRVKNVAIGGIDRAFLGYPSGTNQLFRNWVFGEIYVSEGLEEALNINRNRFKVTHPHYIALREWLHSFLGNIIFKHTLKEFYRKGRDRRRELREEQNIETLDNIVKSEMGKTYKFRFGKLDQNQPLLIDKEEKTITMNSDYSAYQTSAKLSQMIERVFLIFGIALERSNGDMNKLKRLFNEGIEKWIY